VAPLFEDFARYHGLRRGSADSTGRAPQVGISSRVGDSLLRRNLAAAKLQS
jgi:hypothetical protein